MLPDIDKYLKHLESFDLTEKQKTELVHTVWRIMESFADRAFGIDPVQQVIDAGAGKDELPSRLVVEFKTILKNEK